MEEFVNSCSPNYAASDTEEAGNSQNSDLSETQLDKIVLDSGSASTKRSTDWGIRRFRGWCMKRGKDVFSVYKC